MVTLEEMIAEKKMLPPKGTWEQIEDLMEELAGLDFGKVTLLEELILQYAHEGYSRGYEVGADDASET